LFGPECDHKPSFRREIGFRDPLNIGSRESLKNIELAIGGLDVAVDDERVRQGLRFLLVRFAPQNVVARKLVLGSLEFAGSDGLSLELLELRNERVDRFLWLMAWLDEGDGIKEVR